jgi:dTDP-4-amino-4,6-dideoxygalactose transaminase
VVQASHRRDDVSFVPFARPDVGVDAANAVRDVILSGWLTTGERCRELEAAFAEAVGARYAVALNSCTAALHLSLEALGVKANDLVITSPYTFASTAEVIRYFDAVPIFVDIDPATFNMSIERLEATIDGLESGDQSFLPPSLRDTVEARAPVAVMPVHVGGVPCDLERIYKLAAAHGLGVVEDAAHAFPSSYESRAIGITTDTEVPSTICFSFYATKTITTGEGGMLVTSDESIANRVRLMSLHGMSRNTWTRQDSDNAWSYEIVAPGYKYNMTDVAATLGLGQLASADSMRDRRAAIAGRYNESFSRSNALEIPTVPDNVESAWHLYMLRARLDRLAIGRDRLANCLQSRGIGTSVHFMPLHLHAYYREKFRYDPSDFAVATREFEREISLPIYSGMADADVERVIKAVGDIVSEYSR